MTSVLAALVPALDNFTNPKKKFKLTVDLLLIQLLSLHHHALLPENINWGQQCTEQIKIVLKRSLFGVAVLETFDRAMPDVTDVARPNNEEAEGPTHSATVGSSSKPHRPTKKRRKKNVAQENKFLSFHRELFEKLSKETHATVAWVSSASVLLQVFIDANVAHVFAEASTMSEHERTRVVQQVSFKFFTELINIVLPKQTTDTVPNAVPNAVRLNVLATMTELICQRNIFVRSNHDLGLDHRTVIHSMMERVNKVCSLAAVSPVPHQEAPPMAKKKKTRKRKHSSIGQQPNSINETAPPCLKLISLCLHLDHTFWKTFVHVWTPLLHQWKEFNSIKCEAVFVTAIQSFAKVRQLDGFIELLCNVSKAASSQTTVVDMSLVCGTTFQQAAQVAIAQCPAGQVEVLWNIVQNELIRR
jgi:hypothetical protein